MEWTMALPDDHDGQVRVVFKERPLLRPESETAALAAQFSAAVADTGGCGGLTEEVTAGKVKAGTAFLIIAAVGIALTWVADIYSIIAYASRAFAAYYALQCSIACVFAARHDRNGLRAAWYAVLGLLAVCIVAFGSPAE